MAVAKTRLELKGELAQQLQLLRLDCMNYDAGIEASGKHIAVSLRLLLNSIPADKQSRRKGSRSLMDILGLRRGYFLSSVPKMSDKNLLSDAPMLVIQMEQQDARYLPLVLVGGGPFDMCPMQFSEWWLQPILKDNEGARFSRMTLVRSVANKDGGAHVDETLPHDYANLTRQNGLGWMQQNGGFSTALTGKPELACMRQIAHEVLCSVQRFIPAFSRYADPVVPKAANCE